MPDKERQDFAYLEDDDVSQGFIDRGAQPTQSIDLKGLMAELDTMGHDVQTDDLETTPFGKLMEAVPIPILLLDEERRVTFLNQALGKISSKYDSLKGKECISLFPDHKVARHIDSLIKTVYFDRQIQVLESVIQIVDARIWGRVHLQPLRWGSNTSVLVLIENLTLEKTQLARQKKMGRELEKRVEERTRDLAATNEKLQQEISERKRAESELIKHRHGLEQLVVERTRELNATIVRMKQEVKERKKAENSLRSSENRLQLAFHANPGAVSIISLNDGIYLDVNASFCRFSGYSPEEVIGQSDDQLKFWAHTGLRDSLVQTLKDAGRVNDFEAVFRPKTGKMKVGSLSAEVIEIDKQPYMLSVVMDITEQKRAERDQNLFAAALDRIDESVLISDTRGTIKFANSAFESLSGYSREELRGQDINVIRSPENDSNVVNELHENTKNGAVWNGRLVNRAKDGTCYEVESTILPISGKSSRSMNFVIVERPCGNDSSRQELPEQASKMQKASNSARELALEFNDILAALMGYAYLAREKVAHENFGCHDLDRLIALGDRGADLAKRMLMVERITDKEHGSEKLATGTERILLVDDDEHSLEAGKRILESAGYTVTGMTNVLQAMAEFQAVPSFDAVICDLGMPIMSGLEFADALHNMRPDVKVLLCSAPGETYSLNKMKQSRVRDLLFKPIHPTTLCEALRRILDHGDASTLAS
jgi:PAS domain S-box-containing protein